MNQQDNQGPEGFEETNDPGSNPFTQDLKGEFASTFDTNTNPVSQIFREGGFGGQDRTRNIALIGAIVLLVALAVVFFMVNSESEDNLAEEFSGQQDSLIPEANTPPPEEDFTETPDVPPTIVEEPGLDEGIDSGLTEIPEEVGADEDLTADDGAGEQGVAQESYADDSPYSGGGVPPSLATPPNGAARDYDETSESAEFTWEGSPGGYIMFSRSPNMASLDRRARVSGNSYSFHHPAPGTWYWMVKNGGGSSSINSFTISPPIKRNLSMVAPTPGGALTGNGGVVSWQGDNKVAFYRVEVSNSGWANPMYRFATSGTQLQVQGVSPGSYQIRVGGFSESSGRWEYTSPVDVTVQ